MVSILVFVEVISKCVSFALLIFQGTLLNTFLAKLHTTSWWAWFTTDLLIIFVWAISLALVRRSFMKTRQRQASGDHVDGADPEQSPNEIKYAYIAWLVYVIFLCPRVLLIFLNVNGKIKEGEALGPNLLKVGVSCTPLIYLSLVYGFHNAEPHSERKVSIQNYAASGTLDLFDSTDLLELLFEPHHGQLQFPGGYETAIAFFASVNWFLPAMGLIEIRMKTKKHRVLSLPYKAINVICVMAFVNIPNLVIRAVLWHKYNADVSVLIMKNVMCIFLGLYEIAEYFGDRAPQKCEKCEDTFTKAGLPMHRQNCRVYSKSMSI